MGAERGVLRLRLEDEERSCGRRRAGTGGEGLGPLGRERVLDAPMGCTSLLEIPPGLSPTRPCLGPPGLFPPVLLAEGAVPGED